MGRALEGKGFVEPDPGGWYRPRPPRAVAAAMLTRIEEEARSRAKLVLEVSEKLASLTEPPRPREGVVTAVGPYSIASAIAEASRGAPVIYIVASNVLQMHTDLLESVAKNAAGITPVVRVILGPRIGREVEDRLRGLGIEVKTSRPHVIDLAVTPTILIIILEDPYRREPIAVIVRDPGQAGHAYKVIEDLWLNS